MDVFPEPSLEQVQIFTVNRRELGGWRVLRARVGLTGDGADSETGRRKMSL